MEWLLVTGEVVVLGHHAIYITIVLREQYESVLLQVDVEGLVITRREF